MVIGAGSGLSTAACYTYSGERMQKYFDDFAEKYGIREKKEAAQEKISTDAQECLDD